MLSNACVKLSCSVPVVVVLVIVVDVLYTIVVVVVLVAVVAYEGTGVVVVVEVVTVVVAHSCCCTYLLGARQKPMPCARGSIVSRSRFSDSVVPTPIAPSTVIKVLVAFLSVYAVTLENDIVHSLFELYEQHPSA